MEKQVNNSVQRRRVLTPVPPALDNSLSLRTCACGEASGIDGLCPECRDRQFTSHEGASIEMDHSLHNPSFMQPETHPAEQTTVPGSSASSSPFSGHNFSQVQVHATTSETIQTKLKVNQQGYSYEQEADQAAEHVSATATVSSGEEYLESNGLPTYETPRHRKSGRTTVSPALVNGASPVVQDISRSTRQSFNTETQTTTGPSFGHNFSQMRIHHNKAATPFELPAHISRIAGTPGPGEPLHPNIQSALESSLLVDMDAVRVHTDAPSAAAAESLSARAFTYGPHIFLGSGESPSDLSLMAHEGVHVVQQQGVPMLQTLTNTPVTDGLEQEARFASLSIQSGEHVLISGRTRSPGIQREEKAGSSSEKKEDSSEKEGGGSIISKFLDKVVTWVKRIPGYDLLGVILGRDPVSGKPVERNAVNVIRGLVSLIPGGHDMFENLQKAGTIERAFDWFNQQIGRLNLTWETIKGLIRQFWDAFSIWHPIKSIERIGEIIGPTLARLRDFALAAGQKILELIFEGVLSLAGGFGKQILGIIRKAGAVFSQIIKNPLAFLGNLIRAVKGGFQKFSSNIVEHLKAALFGWLFGALQGAGITLPEKWDLKGILSIVMQVLGLTYAKFRGILAKLIGEPRVGFLEKAFDFLQMLVTQGIAAAWQKILEFAGGLTDIVIEGIRNWVAQSIVGAAITKLISMFNPAGAIIQGIITIYNTIAFFIERASQIAALVEAIFNSIASIASGNISAAIDFVEKTMARTLPVIIAFLARLIGLGGISGKIKGIIQRAQTKVEGAMTKVAHFVAEKTKGLVEKGKAAVGIGKEKKEEVGKEKDKAAAEKDKDVTTKVKKELAGQLKGQISSAAEIQPVISAVYNKYKPEGLKSLKVVESVDDPGAFDVNAAASPDTKVSTVRLDDTILEAFELELKDLLMDEQRGREGTSLIAYLQVGNQMMNITHEPIKSKGNKIHAEDRLLDEELYPNWDHYATIRSTDKRMKRIIVINITRSPCPRCAKRLNDFIVRKERENWKVEFDISMLSFWRGIPKKAKEGTEEETVQTVAELTKISKRALKALLKKGAKLRAWDVIEELKDMGYSISKDNPGVKYVQGRIKRLQEVIDEITRKGGRK